MFIVEVTLKFLLSVFT